MSSSPLLALRPAPCMQYVVDTDPNLVEYFLNMNKEDSNVYFDLGSIAGFLFQTKANSLLLERHWLWLFHSIYKVDFAQYFLAFVFLWILFIFLWKKILMSESCLSESCFGPTIPPDSLPISFVNIHNKKFVCGKQFMPAVGIFSCLLSNKRCMWLKIWTNMSVHFRRTEKNIHAEM